MSSLAFSRVLRGGKTTDQRFETRTISSKVNPQQNTLDFMFSLPAAEGETTPVRLQVALIDLGGLLHELANVLPECAGILAECTSIATKVNLQRLRTVRQGE